MICVIILSIRDLMDYSQVCVVMLCYVWVKNCNKNTVLVL